MHIRVHNLVAFSENQTEDSPKAAEKLLVCMQKRKYHMVRFVGILLSFGLPLLIVVEVGKPNFELVGPHKDIHKIYD
jgi:hypothetical protein